MKDAPIVGKLDKLNRRRAVRNAIVAIGLMLTSVSDLSAEDESKKMVAVHVVRPKVTKTATDITLSGDIRARIESSIAFRVDGKLTDRRVEVGQHITADQVLAFLDPTEQQANVDNAKAGLNSAEALLQQAQTNFDRQKVLIASGFTTQASFDAAQASLKTNRALVDVAKAALSTAQEQLTYTKLKAGIDGIVVSRNMERGQVVQTGQTVLTVAQDGPRDAVFNIFEAILIKSPPSRTVDIVLQADPNVHATGEVREISPTVDPSTSTVRVKIGITDTPPQMTLGAAVVGKGRWNETSALVLPWSALFEWEGKPAVWVLDDADVVSVKPVELVSYGTGSLTVAGGLDARERVVTAGIQLLHPGQKVTVVDGDQL